MKKGLFALALTGMFGLTGCIAVYTPAIGVLYTEVRGPITAGGPVGSKEGKACAQAILGLVAEARAKLESTLMGWARGNLDDMRAQLAALVPPGFLREVPATALAEYPRYLKALALRGERAQRDPVRDQARMLELAPFVAALAAADPDDLEAQALRWDLEELRVQVFAQELGAKGGISPKRVAARVQRLRRA